jgi:hypothetical protein
LVLIPTPAKRPGAFLNSVQPHPGRRQRQTTTSSLLRGNPYTLRRQYAVL